MNASGIQQDEMQSIDGELHTKATEGCLLIYCKSAQAAIDLAFLVPPDIFAKLWDLYNRASAPELHTIIMTMPIKDRIASVMFFLQRAHGVQFACYFNLGMILNSSAISA